MPNRPLTLPKQDCADCPIRHKAVCAHCEPDELSVLEEIKFYKGFSAGQPIVWAGDQMEFVGSVVSGVASMTQTMEDGRRQMVGLLLPSDFLGRPNRETVAYDVQAATDIVLCCFRRNPFQQLITTTPHISQRLLEMTLDELDAAREWMLLLGRKTAREKIASFLTIIARRDASLKNMSSLGGPLTFDLPLTREAMADYMGLTIETVSRQMTALRKDGVIELDGKRHIIVPDFEALLDETGDDDDGGLPS